MENENTEIDFKDKKRYQDFCFTSFSDEKPNYDEKICSYMVYQREKCPESGKLHWQGYVEFKSKTSINRMQKMIGCKCRCATRYGTNQQASDYCKKDESSEGERFEVGQLKMQGRRSDLDCIVENIEDGMTCKEIVREHKGKALRVINMIIRGLEVEHDCLAIDKVILMNRAVDKDLLSEQVPQNKDSLLLNNKDTCPEVSGNTKHSSGQNDILEIELEKSSIMEDDMKRLKKTKKIRKHRS